jgi:NAD(P)-dependent dehydrogenase (short-subunit alcohol dehydrogenase family)
LLDSLLKEIFSSIMSPVSVFITGANRGIGLELVRQFLRAESSPKHIFATYRTISDELNKIGEENKNVHLIKMDVTDIPSYPAIVKQVDAVVGEAGLNLLINNAGLLPEPRDLASVTPDFMRQAFEVNCVAPLFFTKEMFPLIERSVKGSQEKGMSCSRGGVVHISSNLASLARVEETNGSAHAYRVSKAALNMSMKSMAQDMKDTGVLIVAVHPGWVQTDMGGPNGQITTEECCKSLLTTFDAVSDKNHGGFIDYENQPIPW